MGQFQQLHDLFRGLRRKPRVAHVRHLARQVEQRLLGIVELRSQRAIFGVINAQALADVIEASSNRERCGSQDDGVKLLEEVLAQNLAHVDRRGRQEYALVPPLVPIHEIPFV